MTNIKYHTVEIRSDDQHKKIGITFSVLSVLLRLTDSNYPLVSSNSSCTKKITKTKHDRCQTEGIRSPIAELSQKYCFIIFTNLIKISCFIIWNENVET